MFVLQVHGRKRWDVHDPDGGPEDQLIVAELAPGDCLYIRRFPHAAWTADTASVHLTVGVVPTAWGDVLRRAVVAAVEDGLSDTPLPAGYATDPAALTAGVADQLGGAAPAGQARPRRDRAGRGDRFWSGRPPILTGQLQQLLALEDIGEDTVVRRRPGAGCASTPAWGPAGGPARRPQPAHACLAPAMGAILAGDRLVVGDLAGLLDPPSRLVLVRRLVGRGSWRRSPGRRPRRPLTRPSPDRDRMRVWGGQRVGVPFAFSPAGGVKYTRWSAIEGSRAMCTEKCFELTQAPAARPGGIERQPAGGAGRRGGGRRLRGPGERPRRASGHRPSREGGTACVTSPTR